MKFFCRKQTEPQPLQSTNTKQGKTMTIPSSLLIREIMHYESFSPKPVLNRIGMPCIGYGFPLWEEALAIVHGNTRLAKHIKPNLPKEQENTALALQRLLQLPVTVTEKTAEELLKQSLLFYAEKLSRHFAGFRHIVNQCTDAVIYPHSSLAAYEQIINTQNLSRHRKETCTKKEQQTKTNIPYCYSKKNSSEQPLHPAFLQSFYSSSAAFAGANPFRQNNFFANQRKQTKRRKKALHFLELTQGERALLRVDSVLFVSHLLGMEIMLQMHDFFFALQEDNYLEASNRLLSHRAASYLGAILAILARRIRETSLDYRDLTRQKGDIPAMRLHRRKEKNYFLIHCQQKNGFPKNRLYERNKMTGVFYGK